MRAILEDSAVRSMLILLLLAVGGYLIKLFGTMASELQQVKETGIKTEVLVNNQHSVMKAEMDVLRAELKASTTAALVAAEKAATLAVQVERDIALLRPGAPAAPQTVTGPVPVVITGAEAIVPVSVVEPPAP